MTTGLRLKIFNLHIGHNSTIYTNSFITYNRFTFLIYILDTLVQNIHVHDNLH